MLRAPHRTTSKGLFLTVSSTDPSARAFSRIAALRLLGASGGGLLLAHCGGGSSSAVPAAAAAATATPSSATGTSSCAVTPEGEIGPYFADDSAAGFNRTDIVANVDGTDVQQGVPLALSIYVRDSRNSCAAMAGVQVDIWHCNAYGVYSDESNQSTSGQTWLRGYQITDANGLVTFQTIVPGWYAGRTTHVHLRVRSSYDQASSQSDGSNTTQLFFPQSLVDTLDATVAPYSSRGVNSTRNANDQVYTPQTKGATLLTLSGSTGGYTAIFTVDLPIT
jgi:protocatechuate 3,4-dioxygenase beta subunit